MDRDEEEVDDDDLGSRLAPAEVAQGAVLLLLIQLLTRDVDIIISRNQIR